MSSSSSSSAAVSGKKIPSRFLGNSGVLVSELCLGAMTFSLQGKGFWGLPAGDQEASHAMLNRYVELGGNFIDTADAYSESEQCLGNWLASKSNIADFRDQMVLATKVRVQTGTGVNDVGLSRKHILANVEQSLKRLHTNFIDLYQVHFWDNRTDIYDVMRTLNDLVRVGKVRNIGFSNFSAWQAQKALDYCKMMGLEPFIANQSQYSLMCRDAEWELIPQCLDANMGFLPWSPLAGGWLSGKFRRGVSEPLAGTRVAHSESSGWQETDFTSKSHEQTYAIIEELCKIGEELKATPAQVALRWVAQKPGVTSVIVGAKTLQQLDDNLQAAFIKLTDEQMQRLDKVSRVPLPYPHRHMNTTFYR